MKIAKKLIILFLCLGVALSCVACDNGDKDDEGDKTPSYTIALDKTECTVAVDEELYLTVTTDAKGSVSWSSSDKAVATVDVNGRILTKEVGVATITAAIENVSASCKLIVTQSVEQNGASLLVDDTCFLSLKDGATKISVEYVAEGANTASAAKTITYRSTDESVVTVSADGIATPVSLGTAVIVVACEGLSASVVTDVYTASISTPTEWLEAIANCCHYPDKISTSDRFYLKNDIDFTDATYDIGNVANGANSDQNNPYHFAAEINGNYHTVKNITDWAVDSEKNPENHQSIFGRTIGATVRNIAFENVVFNSSASYGLCSVMMQHFSDMNGVGTITNTFENISANFTYDYDASDGKGNLAIGVTHGAYGGNLKNVFVYMHTADDAKSLTDLYDNVYGFANAEWVWYGGSLSNVIVLIENVPTDKAQFLNDAAGDQIYKHAKLNCYAVNSVIQAAYYANNCLDKTIWSVTSPDTIPSFIGK